MKAKKIALGMIIFMILVCMIIMILGFINQKEDNNVVIKASGEVQENGTKGNMADINQQLNIIIEQKDKWKNQSAEGNFAYAITDLDHNGRIEIISSAMEGTGWYSYTDIYEINEKFDQILQCEFPHEEGESQADLIASHEWDTYYDEKEDTYHYILKDDMKLNAWEYVQNLRDFVLKDGKITETYLANKESTYEGDADHYQIICKNASGEEISEEVYDNIGDIVFPDIEKKIYQIEWLTNAQYDFNHINEEELLELFHKSYEEFGDFYRMAESNILNQKKWNQKEKARMTAFEKALKDLYEDGILPNGSDAGFDVNWGINDQFAICDIDFDGKDELMIAHVSTAVAGMTETIYDYDEKANELKEELVSFPYLKFYDNGVIQADWSHNQGKAGDYFWPYTLYQYHLEKDEYEVVGMVDAWDKAYTEEIMNLNEPFPSDVDKDNNGMVYYLMSGDSFEYDHIVDDEEYHAWINSYLGMAKKVKIPYQNLTEENIALISK